MKKTIDSHFAVAIIVLIAACLIFAFWFNYDALAPYDENTNSVKLLPSESNRSGVVNADVADPILVEIGTDDLLVEDDLDLSELDTSLEIEDDLFSDLDF